MKTILLMCLAVLWISACNTENPQGPSHHFSDDELEPPEFRECDWDKLGKVGDKNFIAWNEPLPIQDELKDYDDFFHSIMGSYDMATESSRGVLTIERGEGKPYYDYASAFCYRNYKIPIHMKLRAEDNGWEREEEVHLTVAREHLGYVTDREVPAPYLVYPAYGLIMVRDESDVPSFGTHTESPKVKKNETRFGFLLTLEVGPDEDVTLRVEMAVAVSGGPSAGGMNAYKPWFELNGVRVHE